MKDVLFASLIAAEIAPEHAILTFSCRGDVVTHVAVTRRAFDDFIRNSAAAINCAPAFAKPSPEAMD